MPDWCWAACAIVFSALSKTWLVEQIPDCDECRWLDQCVDHAIQLGLACYFVCKLRLGRHQGGNHLCRVREDQRSSESSAVFQHSTCPMSPHLDLKVITYKTGSPSPKRVSTEFGLWMQSGVDTA